MRKYIFTRTYRPKLLKLSLSLTTHAFVQSQRHTWLHKNTQTPTHWPVDRFDNERDGGEADCGGGPFAHRQRPACGPAQQVERSSAHPVDGEAWDGHGGQSLPDEGVHHRYANPCRLPRVVPMCLGKKKPCATWLQVKSIPFDSICCAPDKES